MNPGKRADDEAHRQPASDHEADAHDPTSQSGLPSVWLYATEPEIAAAVESHRSMILRSLRRQRFSPEIAERAFELAVRNLYRSRPPVAAGRSLVRWLRLVAFHRATDLAAREVTAVLSPVVPDVATSDDVGEQVHERLELAAVLRDVERLRVHERYAVLRVIHRELVRMGHPGAQAISRSLEKAEPAVRALEYKRLERARVRLRQLPRRFVVLPGVVRWTLRLRCVGGASGGQLVGAACVAVVMTSMPILGASVGFQHGKSTSPTLATALEQFGAETAIVTPPVGATALGTVITSNESSRPESPEDHRPDGATQFRSPRLPVSESGVQETPSRPDAPLVCVRNAGPVEVACAMHPLRHDVSSGDVLRVEI